MKILVTGANGLLGQKLVGLIAGKPGDTLIATGRGANRNPALGETYHYREMDITDADQVMSVMSSEKPDVVINTAAMTNVDQCEDDKEGCWKMNVTAVEHLVQACQETGAFLLHLSTDFIFDGVHGPYKEEDEAHPISYYGDSKLAAEQRIMDSPIRWAIARTVLVYGIAHDMSRSNIILWVKKNLEERKEIFVVNDQWRTPTLAEDLAEGCYLIASKQVEGVFNISGKDLLTPYEMAIKTADFFELDKSYITETDGSRFSQPAMRPPRTGFVLDKAYEVLNYAPHSFDEGISVLADQIAAKR
ncbi:MAG: NAD(P)-dependent oxidoreductase [Cyclobacteriaceae bacterium]